MRLTFKQMTALKKQFGVDRLWSFSRIDKYRQDKWEYYQQYVTKESKFEGSVYTIFGTMCHDIIQAYYDHKVEREDMLAMFDKKVMDWRTNPEYVFDTEEIEQKYIANLRHYFKYTNVYENAVADNEKLVLAVIPTKKHGNQVIHGYIDTLITDDENDKYIFLDYKTSSRSSFGGKHLPQKQAQLMSYAVALHQMKDVPYEKMDLKFDLLKYVTVTFPLENGKITQTHKDRSLWVEGIRNRLATKLKKAGYDLMEINMMLDEACLNNNLDNIPDEISSLFSLSNNYSKLNLNDDDAKTFVEELGDTMDEILDAEQSSTPELTFEKAASEGKYKMPGTKKPNAVDALFNSDNSNVSIDELMASLDVE